jgi:8-oxo-dGTP pyrophosphatase MutT (NUDIX family)
MEAQKEPPKPPARLRASVVCVDRGALLVVYLRDPHDGSVRPFIPGGAIEAGETPMAAAARETREETGVDVRVDAASERIRRYPFVWGGKEIDCITHFFRAEALDPVSSAPVDDVPYNLGWAWLPLAEVPGALGYHDVILSEIQALL